MPLSCKTRKTFSLRVTPSVQLVAASDSLTTYSSSCRSEVTWPELASSRSLRLWGHFAILSRSPTANIVICSRHQPSKQIFFVVCSYLLCLSIIPHAHPLLPTSWTSMKNDQHHLGGQSHNSAARTAGVQSCWLSGKRLDCVPWGGLGWDWCILCLFNYRPNESRWVMV